MLFLAMWVGKLSEAQALPCKARATPRSNDSRSEECRTSSFSRHDENIFNLYPAKV